MIEVELKLDSRSLWYDMKNDPLGWLLVLVIFIGGVIYSVSGAKDFNYFTVVSNHIKNGSLTTLFTKSTFWIITVNLFASCVVPLIVIILVLPPLRLRRVQKRLPNYKSTLIFYDEKIINDYSYDNVNNHTEVPYSMIKRVTHKKGLFNIKLKNSMLLYDDCFTKGTPAELETLLKEKCPDKCKF
ncbi:hypothetical protein [Ruminococcus sp.]|uniref:hypothetical protein n=1 Tax=Ruminococcus sp. TaxID=41978 RepID=UPI002584A089|nr:hypothetical protein [Ruminococcus sp.]MCR5020272.1 hypothetical protein [Ruminococcus sp.]